MSLLLIQMFPPFLAVVAIYLIVLRVGDVFPRSGSNTRIGLILVYLGGAIGVNTWLMKGFFDSIPDAARRVGARRRRDAGTGLLGRDPAARGARARGGRADLVHLRRSTSSSSRASSCRRRTSSRSPVGLYGFISDQYAQQWGPFAPASCSPRSRSSSSSSSCSASSSRASRGARSRDDARRGTRSSPSRTTTARRCTSRSRRRSSATRHACSCACPRATGADAVRVRYVRDGEPQVARAEIDERRTPTSGGGRRSPSGTPATPYRWLLVRRRLRLRVAERRRACSRRRPRRRRLRPRRPAPAGPTGTSSPSSTRSSPTASRRRGRGVDAARVGGAARVGRAPDRTRAGDAARVVRRRPARDRGAPRPPRRRSARTSST